MMRQPRSQRPGRPSFTVLELLVVIGIIAVIISLTTAAVMAIIRSQETSTTAGAIRKVNGELQAYVRTVLDQAKELPIPASVTNLAGGDPRRAKVIWQKLQLKRNFPMTFREALYPWAVDGDPTKASPISQTDLPPVDSYVKAVQPLVAAGAFAPPGTFIPDESSHLLLLALSTTRRGVSFDPEQALGPSAIYFDAAHNIRGFADAWGQPVVFFRWPTDFPDNLANAVDLQDSADRTLLDANWNNATLYNSTSGPILGRYGVYWFEQLCHLVHDPTASKWTPRGFYAPPAIVSGGPNKRLGLLQVPFNWGLPTAPSPNFGMALDSTDPQGANDNIYSYTLK
jgi:type II secretory pathway pseudopilin PulG